MPDATTVTAAPVLPPLDPAKIEAFVVGADGTLTPFLGIPQVAFVHSTIVPILETGLAIITQIKGLKDSGVIQPQTADLLHQFVVGEITNLGQRMAGQGGGATMTVDALHQFLSAQLANIQNALKLPHVPGLTP